MYNKVASKYCPWMVLGTYCNADSLEYNYSTSWLLSEIALIS